MKKIVCPNCGYEYLPCEIYLPKNFLGHAKYVERDISGKILDVSGGIMDLKESYRCDKCNMKFKIMADVKFNCVADAQGFKDTYSTKISKPNLFMSED